MYLLESFTTINAIDSIIRRIIGNECLRRKMFSEAKHSFDASMHILLQLSKLKDYESKVLSASNIIMKFVVIIISACNVILG